MPRLVLHIIISLDIWNTPHQASRFFQLTHNENLYELIQKATRRWDNKSFHSKVGPPAKNEGCCSFTDVHFLFKKNTTVESLVSIRSGCPKDDEEPTEAKMGMLDWKSGRFSMVFRGTMWSLASWNLWQHHEPPQQVPKRIHKFSWQTGPPWTSRFEVESWRVMVISLNPLHLLHQEVLQAANWLLTARGPRVDVKVHKRKMLAGGISGPWCCVSWKFWGWIVGIWGFTVSGILSCSKPNTLIRLDTAIEWKISTNNSWWFNGYCIQMILSSSKPVAVSWSFASRCRCSMFVVWVGGGGGAGRSNKSWNVGSCGI